MKRILIVGATSGIGRGLAETYLADGNIVGVTGRREPLLTEITAPYPGKAFHRITDITRIPDTITQLQSLVTEMGGMDILVISSGTGDINPSLDYALEEPTLLTNILGFTSLADWSFQYFQQQKAGQIVVISSLAALRGSADAPAYNASKAYQINYAEGLRQKAQRLKLPIAITDVRPGFVDTAMAKGEGLFWVCPVDKAVKQIRRAIDGRRRKVYVSRRWRLAAILVRNLPEWVWRRI